MQAKRVFHLILMAIAVLFTLACGQKSSCSGPGFGASGDAGSGGGVGAGSTTCGSSGSGGGGTSSISDFLYYLSSGTSNGTPTTNAVQAVTLSSSGTFAPAANFTAPSFAYDTTQNIIIVNKQFLYIPQPTLNQIQAYSINRTTGALTAVLGSPFPTSGGDTVVSDPKGKFLFLGGAATGLISVFQINSTTGVLTQNTNSPFATGLADSAAIRVDSQGKFLYVSEHNPFLPTGVFLIDQTTGDLSLALGSPFNIGIFEGEFAAPSTASEFYVGFSFTAGDNHLYVDSVDSTSGIPTAVASSPFPTAKTPFILSVHPNGKFVYSFEEDAQQNLQPFEGFQIDAASGTLTAISNSPFTSLSNIEFCQFDQGGTAFCSSTNGFTVLSVDPSTGVPSTSIPELQTNFNFPFAVTN